MIKTLYYLLIIIFVITGCNNENFSIYDPLDKDLTIYAVLDSRLDYSLLKIHQLYFDSTKMKPGGKITAVLEQNTGDQFYLKDTLINDGNKFVYFKIPTKILKRGYSYKLIVMKEGYNTSWAVCKYHIKPNLWSSTYIYSDIKRERWRTDICFSKNVSGVFLVKTFIDYELSGPTGTDRRYAEIPLDASISKFNPRYNENMFIYEYDEKDLDILKSTIQDVNKYDPYQILIGQDYYIVRFEDNGLLLSLKKLGVNTVANKIKINGMFSVLYSIDENYYRNIMVKLNEQWSIRLDQEYYWTNVTGYDKFASGFFGSFTADTVRFNMLQTHISRFGYIDGQKY